MTSRRLCAALGVLLVAGAVHARAQSAPRSAAPQNQLSEEDRQVAASVAAAWAALVRGDLDVAQGEVRNLQARYPRSGAVLDLLVEIGIARSGAAGGLAEYERWLGGRTLEEPRVVRRVARARLTELARQTESPEARVAALQALTADGDSWAAGVLAAGASAGAAAETRAMAELGSTPAVENLISALDVGATESLGALEALGRSRNPIAIPALIRQLDSPKPEIRGAAAEALGHLGGPDALAKLRAIVRSDTPYVRGRAAAALYRLGDDTGVSLLRDLAASESPTARLVAARALSPRPDATWRALVEELARSDQPEVRLGAANLLVDADPARARGILQDLAGSGNPAIREEAGRTLASAVSGDLPALRALLKSPDRLTQAAAARAVLSLTR